MTAIQGHLTGLPPHALRVLERITRRRVPTDIIVTPELARSLAEASRETKRQVGVLIHRSGTVDTVIVGTPSGILLPDIGRLRAAEGRFRGVRLVHTHLFNEPLSRDDLTDLTRLRLDLVAAVQLNEAGEPRALSWAYNVPTHLDSEPKYHLEGPIPWGSPQPDFGRLISALEAEFARHRTARAVTGKDGRAILVHASEKQKARSENAPARLTELESLARTAGVNVVDRVIQIRDRLDPRFVVGKGKLEEIILRAIELDATVIIFDCNLTPSQANEINQRTDLKIIDRTQLILDIFAQRAESRDGKLKVELAQLKYALPRLDLRDDALSRLTGGIGGRGPGETKLEIGRRRARERVSRLEKELEILERRRDESRANQHKDGMPRLSLVGYTNAGKSTLLNTLTHANVLCENRLFATLDTRSRRLFLGEGLTAILTDTVGFIRDMPVDLFAAFRATFEEARHADLLWEVIDISDEEHLEHMKTTAELLARLGLGEVPRIQILNKIDRVDPERIQGKQTGVETVVVSALERHSLQALLSLTRQLLLTSGAKRKNPAPALETPTELTDRH